MGKFIAAVIVLSAVMISCKALSTLDGSSMGLATGILFGVLAGIPLAMLTLASNRRNPEPKSDDPESTESSPWDEADFDTQTVVLKERGDNRVCLGMDSKGDIALYCRSGDLSWPIAYFTNEARARQFLTLWEGRELT